MQKIDHIEVVDQLSAISTKTSANRVRAISLTATRVDRVGVGAESPEIAEAGPRREEVQ
jgi:hypothetical protein